MAEVVLFHHALGLTPGMLEFAGALRSAGHSVHTPDLFEGRTFDMIEEGVAHAEEVGFGEVIERGVRAVQDLPEAVVYAGFSLGVLPAQKLAQTRPGARGALFFYSCVPPTEFGPGWPEAVPVQITAWTRIRSSSVKATSMPPGRWSRRLVRANSSSTPATTTTSPTAPCLPTIPPPPPYSRSESWPSSRTADPGVNPVGSPVEVSEWMRS